LGKVLITNTSNNTAHTLVRHGNKMKPSEAAKNALKNVLEAAPSEKIAIFCDDEKASIGEAFAQGALALGLWTRLHILKTNKIRHETPPELVEIITAQKPDIYINIMRGTGDETVFRVKTITLETRGKKARLGHCPGVTLDMLTNGALALTTEQHNEMQKFALKLMQNLASTIRVEVINPAGTKLSFSTENKPFFTDTKLDWKELKWMNLPTGEVMVAPVENSLNGKLVCDLAIGGIPQLLKTPVEITAKNGKAENITSKDKTVLAKVKEWLATDEWSNIVGEFAFGINKKARLVNEFLEAEKVFGTTHMAFGHNLDFPNGKNPSKNHVDFLISKPTVKITEKNGETKTILQAGKFKEM
jgi:leucyl aminopeptidase (aminopeptidase T)